MTTWNNTIVVDYGVGNLDSIRRALEECGGNVKVSDSAADIQNASHIVLPGVGAFNAGMDNLRARGLIEVLTEQVSVNKIPFLGVCLGMQLLADRGFEGGESAGLGLIKGEVRLLKRQNDNERIPHVGWNEVIWMKESPLSKNIISGKDFYFVHSYHFVCSDPNNTIGHTKYADGFVSAIQENNIFGVQFHPEKSQKVGFQILKNFLAL